MKIQEIYNLAINRGIESDFRGKKGVENILKRKNEKYKELSEKDKADFNAESLKNPYLDSGIHHIEADREIKRIFVGIDIGPAEILIAKEIGGVDLIIAHHPIGKGLAYLSEVMDLQCDVLNFYGIPINIAENLTKEKIEEVARGLGGLNHYRTIDAAKLLKMNLMNVHTPADNLAANFLKGLIENNKPERTSDLINLLKSIPEYKNAAKTGAGPKIFVGSKENHCGKIALIEITGGTECSPKLYEKMSQAGIGTIIGTHISEESRKEAQAANLNVVIAGHISSDSLGMNLFLDELERQGIEITPCSGLIRISRNK